MTDRQATDEDRRKASVIVAAARAIKRIIAKERNEDAATTER
jgi:hypothetical protein